MAHLYAFIEVHKDETLCVSDLKEIFIHTCPDLLSHQNVVILVRAFFLFFVNPASGQPLTVTPSEPNINSAHSSLMTAQLCSSSELRICSSNRILKEHDAIDESACNLSSSSQETQSATKSMMLSIHSTRKLEPSMLVDEIQGPKNHTVVPGSGGNQANFTSSLLLFQPSIWTASYHHSNPILGL